MEVGVFMALIKCEKCGEQISDKAKKCPHCGKSFQVSKIKDNSKKIFKLKTYHFLNLINQKEKNTRDFLILEKQRKKRLKRQKIMNVLFISLI